MIVRRRLLLVLVVVAALTAIIGVRMALVTPPEEGVLLSTGKYRVRYLTAGLGTVTYNSESPVQAAIRPWLPRFLANKLGTPLRFTHSASTGPNGEPALLLAFQLLSPENRVQNSTEIVFDHVDLPEDSGFVFRHEIRGYSSSGSGTSMHDVPAFPRRQKNLRFQLYEPGDRLLIDRVIPNPGYKDTFPELKPLALPQSLTVDHLTVSLTGVDVHKEARRVQPKLSFASSDAAWQHPTYYSTWTDATGNTGEWLSPYEPAWKLNVTMRRSRTAHFQDNERWLLDPAPVPQQLAIVPVDSEKVVQGIRLKVRYVAPAGEVTEEGGSITMKPGQPGGRYGMGTSAGSRMQAGKMVQYHSIECGTPFIRVDHDPLSQGEELLFDVRDQDGQLLNANTRVHMGGVNRQQFQAVGFEPQSETRTVQLEIRVNKPRKVEFVVPPPAELRNASAPKDSP